MTRLGELKKRRAEGKEVWKGEREVGNYVIGRLTDVTEEGNADKEEVQYMRTPLLDKVRGIENV